MRIVFPTFMGTFRGYTSISYAMFQLYWLNQVITKYFGHKKHYFVWWMYVNETDICLLNGKTFLTFK